MSLFKETTSQRSVPVRAAPHLVTPESMQKLKNAIGQRVEIRYLQRGKIYEQTGPIITSVVPFSGIVIDDCPWVPFIGKDFAISSIKLDETPLYRNDKVNPWTNLHRRSEIAALAKASFPDEQAKAYDPEMFKTLPKKNMDLFRELVRERLLVAAPAHIRASRMYDWIKLVDEISTNNGKVETAVLETSFRIMVGLTRYRNIDNSYILHSIDKANGINGNPNIFGVVLMTVSGFHPRGEEFIELMRKSTGIDGKKLIATTRANILRTAPTLQN
jgi:hypothetical protein